MFHRIKLFMDAIFIRLIQTKLFSNLFPINNQAILLLSLPRSGSSWVGEVLGQAKNCLYLREPITQGYKKFCKYTLTDISNITPPKEYLKISNLAFRGISLIQRDKEIKYKNFLSFLFGIKKLVIKEVNPLACKFFISNYKPKIIILVRHPAAVALSFNKLGWIQCKDALMGEKDIDIWQRHGMRQGYILNYLINTLKGYSDCLTVSFESICENPLSEFRKLFKFADLIWDDSIEDFIRKHDGNDQDSSPYSIFRNSATIANKWKKEITDENLNSLRKGFTSYSLPFYEQREDWQLEDS